MNRYEIRCTEEQTRKALELGATLQELPLEASIIQTNEKLYQILCPNIIFISGRYYHLPTAEQMLGWLEEQKIFIHIDYDFSDNEKPYKSEMCLFNGMTNHRGWFASRKEAMLAAIDTALRYLTEVKEE